MLGGRLSSHHTSHFGRASERAVIFYGIILQLCNFLHMAPSRIFRGLLASFKNTTTCKWVVFSLRIQTLEDQLFSLFGHDACMKKKSFSYGIFGFFFPKRIFHSRWNLKNGDHKHTLDQDLSRKLNPSTLKLGAPPTINRALIEGRDWENE